MRACWRATRPFYESALLVQYLWPRSSAAATIGIGAAWRGATLRSSTRRARCGASSTWRGSCLLSVVCFIRRRAGLLPPGDVAATAWGSTRRHAAGLRVGVPDPGPRPRRAEVASAGAAGLRAETCVTRETPGTAAAPRVAMYPKVTSSTPLERRLVAVRRGSDRLTLRTRGAGHRRQHARNERHRRLPFAGAARTRRSQIQAHT